MEIKSATRDLLNEERILKVFPKEGHKLLFERIQDGSFMNIVLTDGIAIGFVMLLAINKTEFELSAYIDKEFNGKGYAFEACSLSIGEVFNNPVVKNIIARTKLQGTGYRLAKKLDFEEFNSKDQARVEAHFLLKRK